MIVRTLEQIIGTERGVRAETGNWVSRRFVLDDDQAGFSFHETIIKTGEVHSIKGGTLLRVSLPGL